VANNDQCQRLIQQSIARRSDMTLEDALDQLWSLLLVQLVGIMGNGGFNALLARSILLTKTEFPWLEECNVHQSSKSELATLRRSIEQQSAVDGLEASQRLLLVLTSVLVDLIGEPLGIGILMTAWGDNNGHV